MNPETIELPSREAFEKLYKELETGERGLTLSDVGRVFGQPFWELLVMCMLDANDAARAIQMSMLRMRESADQMAREIVAQEAAKAPKIEVVS